MATCKHAWSKISFRSKKPQSSVRHIWAAYIGKYRLNTNLGSERALSHETDAMTLGRCNLTCGKLRVLLYKQKIQLFQQVDGRLQLVYLDDLVVFCALNKAQWSCQKFSDVFSQRESYLWKKKFSFFMEIFDDEGQVIYSRHLEIPSLTKNAVKRHKSSQYVTYLKYFRPAKDFLKVLTNLCKNFVSTKQSISRIAVLQFKLNEKKIKAAQSVQERLVFSPVLLPPYAEQRIKLHLNVYYLHVERAFINKISWQNQKTSWAPPWATHTRKMRIWMEAAKFSRHRTGRATPPITIGEEGCHYLRQTQFTDGSTQPCGPIQRICTVMLTAFQIIFHLFAKQGRSQAENNVTSTFAPEQTSNFNRVQATPMKNPSKVERRELERYSRRDAKQR